MAVLTTRQEGDSHLMCNDRPRDFSVIVGRWPITKKRSLAHKPNIRGIEFVICDLTRRGENSPPPPPPHAWPLPRRNRLWVVDADRPVVLNDPAAALRGLPFESRACQSLRGDSRPHEPPELFVAPCPFACLNSRGHLL